jgi:hypothetical protein
MAAIYNADLTKDKETKRVQKRNGENCSDAVGLMTIVRSRSNPSRAGIDFSDVVHWQKMSLWFGI